MVVVKVNFTLPKVDCIQLYDLTYTSSAGYADGLDVQTQDESLPARLTCGHQQILSE